MLHFSGEMEKPTKYLDPTVIKILVDAVILKKV